MWSLECRYGWCVLYNALKQTFAPSSRTNTTRAPIGIIFGTRAKIRSPSVKARSHRWHGSRLDAVGRQCAISGIGLAINSVRRPIGSSVFGLNLESRLAG